MKLAIAMSLFFIANAFVNINICGSGIYLPYYMGVLGCIKKNYPISNYSITGISGGALCSLLYTQEKDLSNHDKLWDMTIGKNISVISLHTNIKKVREQIEYNLKLRYSGIKNKISENISIISTNVGNFYEIKSETISSFDNINDLIDFSLCSSYIPYISGSNFSKYYKDGNYIDGQVTYENIELSDVNTLYLHKGMWNRDFSNMNNLLLSKSESQKLFEYGWNDTNKNNKKILRYSNNKLS